jgi:hypothetical protein
MARRICRPERKLKPQKFLTNEEYGSRACDKNHHLDELVKDLFLMVPACGSTFAATIAGGTLRLGLAA